MNCLVVDDSPEDAELIGRILTGGGHRVTCVDGGYAAVALLHGGGFDAVLLDFHMDDMNGASVVEALRGIDRTTPVLIVSGSDEEASVLAALRAGATGYLLKTDAPSRLLDALREAADGHGALSSRVTGGVIKALRESPKRRAPSQPIAKLR